MIPPREVVIDYNAELFNTFFTFQRNILIIYIIKYTYIWFICKFLLIRAKYDKVGFFILSVNLFDVIANYIIYVIQYLRFVLKH